MHRRVGRRSPPKPTRSLRQRRSCRSCAVLSSISRKFFATGPRRASLAHRTAQQQLTERSRFAIHLPPAFGNDEKILSRPTQCVPRMRPQEKARFNQDCHPDSAKRHMGRYRKVPEYRSSIRTCSIAGVGGWSARSMVDAGGNQPVGFRPRPGFFSRAARASAVGHCIASATRASHKFSSASAMVSGK